MILDVTTRSGVHAGEDDPEAVALLTTRFGTGTRRSRMATRSSRG